MNRNHRGPFLSGLLGIFLAAAAPAQESILLAYQRSFARADLAAKAEVLEDAATDERAAEFIGPLYGFALEFSLSSADILRDDPGMIILTSAAAKGAGRAGYTAAADTLWRIFTAYGDSFTRVEVLGALAVLGKGNPQLTENLNRFLESQNSRFRSGIVPDYQVLQAAVSALGSLGTGASYPVLFSALNLGYPASIGREVSRALDAIEGDYGAFLLGVIENNPPGEKLAAFRAGMGNFRLTGDQRGSLAETALRAGLDSASGGGESAETVSELRYLAAPVLTELRWTRAAPLAERHFYQARADYEKNALSGEFLIEAVRCLGVMGSSGAVQALTLQLGLFNSRIEGNGAVDEALVLEVINALGELGSRDAYNNLSTIAYLPYPETVKAAAASAVNRLKW
jgi:HEAT repeat protein